MASRAASRMFHRSISKASAAPTAHARARSRIRSARTSRRSGSRRLLSSRPRMGRSGLSTTAAAKTGPNSAPRPAASTTATARKPARRMARSWRLVGMLRKRQLLRGRFALPQTGGLAFQTPQIVQLGAADPAGPHNIDMIDHGSVQRKDALDTLAEADFAHGDRRTHPSVILRDNGSLERLQALLVAFFDLDVDTNGVAWAKLGVVHGSLVLGQDLGQ